MVNLQNKPYKAPVLYVSVYLILGLFFFLLQEMGISFGEAGVFALIVIPASPFWLLCNGMDICISNSWVGFPPLWYTVLANIFWVFCLLVINWFYLKIQKGK